MVVDPCPALLRGGGERGVLWQEALSCGSLSKKQFKEISNCKSGLFPTARQKHNWRCGQPTFPPQPGDK